MENTESKRPRREKLEPEICPICGVTIRQNELKQHYEIEMEKLSKISSNNKCKKHVSSPTTSTSKNGECSHSKAATGDDCWGTYQKIKNNRQSRLKVKSRKQRRTDEQICPVCNERTTEDITMHVEMCLRKSESQGNGTIDSSEDEIDVDGDVYEWAGQTRVRASTLLPGGNYSSAGIGTTIRNHEEDEEDSELNVDGDDTQIYGAAQYSERDILLIDENEQQGYLRDLVIGENSGNTSQSRRSSSPEIPDPEKTPPPLTRVENNQNIANSISPNSKVDSKVVASSPDPKIPESARQVIESLKAKIREYENFIKNKPKCLICLDDFKKPVVSICCWHVYCQECWLYSLGARKLCPQCSMITSASDLRRIYL